MAIINADDGDDTLRNLLFRLFNAAIDRNKDRPDGRKANARQLAEETYMDWALAANGNTNV